MLLALFTAKGTQVDIGVERIQYRFLSLPLATPQVEGQLQDNIDPL